MPCGLALTAKRISKILYEDNGKIIKEHYIRAGEKVEIPPGRILKVDSGVGYIDDNTAKKYVPRQVIKLEKKITVLAHENSIIEEIFI